MQEKEALMHCNPTRRTFLKGTAATAALAAVGTCSVAAWRAEQAEAAATGAVKIQGASLCNGCSSKCGLVATTLGASCSRCAAATCIPTPRAPSAVEVTAWRRSPIPTSA